MEMDINQPRDGVAVVRAQNDFLFLSCGAIVRTGVFNRRRKNAVSDPDIFLMKSWFTSGVQPPVSNQYNSPCICRK